MSADLDRILERLPRRYTPEERERLKAWAVSAGIATGTTAAETLDAAVGVILYADWKALEDSADEIRRILGGE